MTAVARASRPPAGEVTHRELAALASSPRAADAPVLIDAMAQRLLGHRACSVNRLHPQAMELERLYSTIPQAYAVGGRKPKAGSAWAEQVLVRGEVFLASWPEEVAEAFDDHARLFELGFGSVLNTPVLFEDRCLGTFNLLHEAGWYRRGDEALTRVLAHLLVPFLLASGGAEPA